MVRRKISRISARFLWIAGTRMWLGLSSPSWTMSSARSVSCAAMPAASSASFSPISWVAIDLTLTTSEAPVACTSRVTISLASFASRAQCTVPPRAVTCRSRETRCSSRRAIVAALMARPASRSSSQSGTSPTTAARLPRMVLVAWPRLRAQLAVAQRRAGGVRERLVAPQVPDARAVPSAARGRRRSSGAPPA